MYKQLETIFQKESAVYLTGNISKYSCMQNYSHRFLKNLYKFITYSLTIEHLDLSDDRSVKFITEK